MMNNRRPLSSSAGMRLTEPVQRTSVTEMFDRGDHLGTNTSNPTVHDRCGVVAKKAVEKGLKVPPYVKTSLAQGSRVVTNILTRRAFPLI